jgi:hypothetical protein
MNSTHKLLAALMATVALAACDKPTVVNAPPATPVVIPAPAPGPQGPQGEPGKSEVIVVPAPAPMPAAAASEPK